ncbi:MAG: Myo-inositol 2-dehydrogenase [uncultured Solirubrobacteraceae bacterium]|uniref:Myo-inositol 2-dehydrogenase n=1 Tax=uncultured Solirubrobacteraceae bacterium TaxID=1162706 RepID=A0A6J4RRM3_9ACTN|nr:MAG: Myo-inositol 2-dehydrogenase [uncultured Solirubrobacteraceae bacterium]
MSRPLRVAIAGYGLAGEVFHAPLVAATEGLSLVALTTSDPARAARAREAYRDVDVYADADELLRRRAGDLDLLVVATPNRLHVPIARSALTHRIAVVMDKPLAAEAAPAAALVDDFHAAAVPFTVFQNRRWDGDFLTVQRIVDAGELGPITRFESRYERFRPAVDPDAWRERAAADEGGGLLLDLGAHLIDQALTLFGYPQRVYAEIAARRRGAQVDDDVFVALEHAGGVRSHLWMSAIAPVGGRSLRASGTRAGIETPGLDPQEDQLAAGLRPGAAGWGAGEPARWVDASGARTREIEPGAYERFYAGVRDALRDATPMPVDARDSVAALRVIEAARRSARSAEVIEMSTQEEAS